MAIPGSPEISVASTRPIAIPNTVPSERDSALIAVSPRELVLVKTRKEASTAQNQRSRDKSSPKLMAIADAMVICRAARSSGLASEKSIAWDCTISLLSSISEKPEACPSPIACVNCCRASPSQRSARTVSPCG